MMTIVTMMDAPGASESGNRKRKRDQEAPTLVAVADSNKKPCIQGCFEWLPAEMLHKVLMLLPPELDTVHRMVCREWNAILGERRQTPPLHPIKWAADNKRMPLMDFILNPYRPQPSDAVRLPSHDYAMGVMRCCVREGWTDTLKCVVGFCQDKKLLMCRPTFGAEDLMLALKSGCVDVARYIGCPSDINCYSSWTYAAYEGGSQDCIDWVNACISGRWYVSSEHAMMATIRGGHLQLLKKLVETHERPFTTDMARCAIRHKQVDILKWGLETWHNLNVKIICHDAFRSAHKDVIKCLIHTVPLAAIRASCRERGGFVISLVKSRCYESLDLLKQYNLLNTDLEDILGAVRGDGKDVEMLEYLAENVPELAITNTASVLHQLARRSLEKRSMGAFGWCLDHLVKWGPTRDYLLEHGWTKPK